MKIGHKTKKFLFIGLTIFTTTVFLGCQKSKKKNIHPKTPVISLSQKTLRALKKETSKGVFHYSSTTPILSLKNRSKTPIKVKSLDIEFLEAKEIVHTKTIRPNELKENIYRNGQKISDDANEVDRLNPFWNKMKDENYKVTNERSLELKQGFVFHMGPFHINTDSEKNIDRMRIKITYHWNGKTLKNPREVKLNFSQPKNKYKFPLKGIWYVRDSWDNPSTHSIKTDRETEYAQKYTIIGYNGTIFRRNLDYAQRGNADTYAYKQRVFAPADGQIVALQDSIPNNSIVGKTTSPLGTKAIKILRSRGRLAHKFGNFIIIKHENDEYSLLANLKPFSLQVNLGDEVKSGQHIAEVGNTRGSKEPHLHFQIQDSLDPSRGQNIVPRFSNLRDDGNQKLKAPPSFGQVVHSD